jgi:hypothetical protein
MKKFTLALCTLFALSALTFAGPERYSGKEMKQVVPPPCPEWYADFEWDISLWGAYAFTETDNDRATLEEMFFDDVAGTYDRFLGGDHAWGGGADIKYFFWRYFGVGIEGFGLAAHGSHYDYSNFGFGAFGKDSDHHGVGAALGTLTLRYPFHCSRFSPYVWGGGGAIFGGHNERPIYFGDFLERVDVDDETRALGQFGGGLEIRLTRHIGWMGDFSWNFVDGPHNNFGMVRSGFNFAF